MQISRNLEDFVPGRLGKRESGRKGADRGCRLAVEATATARVVERLLPDRARREVRPAGGGILADEVHRGIGIDRTGGGALVDATAPASVVEAVLGKGTHQLLDGAHARIVGLVMNLRIERIRAARRTAVPDVAATI